MSESNGHPVGHEISIASLDHLVLTVRDLDATRRFYCDFLGMTYTLWAILKVPVFGKLPGSL